MAELDGPLWPHNLTKVVVVDVTDDYALMQPPLPTACYPVLVERWLPRHGLIRRLPDADLVDGYQYDWHEAGDPSEDGVVVGVVKRELVDRLLAAAHAESAAPS